MAIFATRRKWLVTSRCAASRSPCSRQRLASMYSSCASSMGNRRILWRYRLRPDSAVSIGETAVWAMTMSPCLPADRRALVVRSEKYVRDDRGAIKLGVRLQRPPRSRHRSWSSELPLCETRREFRTTESPRIMGRYGDAYLPLSCRKVPIAAFVARPPCAHKIEFSFLKSNLMVPTSPRSMFPVRVTLSSQRVLWVKDNVPRAMRPSVIHRCRRRFVSRPEEQDGSHHWLASGGSANRPGSNEAADAVGTDQFRDATSCVVYERWRRKRHLPSPAWRCSSAQIGAGTLRRDRRFAGQGSP